MKLFRRMGCRIVQGAFRLAIPFLPYRQPELLSSPEKAAELVRNKGVRKVLVITDKGVRSHGLTDPLTKALTWVGIEYEIFDETSANPTMSEVEAAVKMYYAQNCDGLVAIGGGSPIDCAKGVCARLIKPKKSLIEMKGVLRVRGKQPFFLAVPTTAGTGSEVTIAAVITDDTTHEKFTVLSFCLAPKYVLLDPGMTRTLPPAITAETGMDALTHAVEANIGRSTTAFTRRLSVAAVRLIKDNLPTVFRDGEDLAARTNMQLAAYDAGLAFTISYVGYVHAAAHALGGAYGLPHGRTNATLLPLVLRMYGKACVKKLARLARESGVCDPSLSDMDAADAFISWIDGLNEAFGIPKSVSIREEDIPMLAQRADREANPLYPVPVLMDAEQLEKVFRMAMKAESGSEIGPDRDQRSEN